MYNLNEQEKKLLDFLIAIPPDMDGASHYLQTQNLAPSEITRVSIEYADYCFCDAGDYAYQHGISHPHEVIPNLNSTYILDVIKLMLQHGLNPNAIFDGYNIMDWIKFVDNEFLAADTLALLLEHGGDANLMLPSEGETLFEAVNFDVFFGAIEQYDRQRYASLVHCWLVLIGYGARCSKGSVQVFKEYDSSNFFDLQKLKSHRNYSFGMTHLENDFAISIYDKETLWEVVRIR